MSFDHEKLMDILASLPGALLYGIYHLAAIISAGQTATALDYIRAGINLIFAAIAGAILAYFLAAPITSWLPIEALHDRAAVAFCIGAGGWELLPFVITTLQRLIGGIGARQP